MITKLLEYFCDSEVTLTVQTFKCGSANALLNKSGERKPRIRSLNFLHELCKRAELSIHSLEYFSRECLGIFTQKTELNSATHCHSCSKY